MTQFIEKNYINGEWVVAQSGRTIDVLNPADNAVLGSVPDMSEAEVSGAIAAAHDAFSVWSNMTVYERGAILQKWADLIKARQNDLAEIVTLESGKPLKEAMTEASASYVEWNIEEAKRAYGETIPSVASGRDMLTIKQPIGVAAMITPWNFPFGMITRKVSPALAAGCTVVLKPDHQTPFTAHALAQLAHEAGMPKGVLNIVTGDAEMIGKIFTADERVGKISFTGSTRVGKLLMAQAASTIKNISLELGGNAPFIVFESANIKTAVQSLLDAKIRNAGQTCICPNRIYVQRNIHDEFVAQLAHAFKDLKIGNGMDDGVQVGPLINESGIAKVERLVTRAVQSGARIVIGGKRHSLFHLGGGAFFEPTILTDIAADMDISCEEIFGPVVAVQAFDNEAEVVRHANDTIFGLASYMFTNDLAQYQRVAKQLQYGMVGVNTGLISVASAPFGGVKQSGLGREGGACGIDEYLETKYIAIQS